MIRKECFVRNHFWVEKEKLYRPMMSFENGVRVSFSWKQEELFFRVEEESGEPFSVSFPKFKEKDALLLYLDTRPSLNVRSMKRHCHQFVLLPEAVEGVFSYDSTRFAGYESRPLVPDNVIQVSSFRDRGCRGYEVSVPLRALFGYEDELKEMSFALGYFSHVEKEPLYVPIPTIIPEKVPYMWPFLHLIS